MRKLFGTDGIRGEYGRDPMTLQVAYQLGYAVGRFFAGSFVIGMDTRVSSAHLEKAVVAGIKEAGCKYISIGVAPTPAIAFITKYIRADAGLVISASHNPYTDNGIKLFDGNGFKLSDKDEEKIEEFMFSFEKQYNGDDSGEKEEIKRDESLLGAYTENLLNNIPINLSNMKIVIDCANGAAFKVAPIVFTKMGAQVIAINSSPDGKNINKEAGSLHPNKLAQEVLDNEADVGIALDGDADRILLVDESGNILCGDTIMAMLALDMAKEKKLNKNTLVVTHYSNMGLDKLLQENGCKVVRVANGDRYVTEEMRKNGYNLGGEQSGHIICFDSSTTGDGLMAACLALCVIKKGKKKLSELSSVLKKYPQVLQNVDVKEKVPIEQLKTNELIKQYEEELGNEGRVIFRYSGTQQKARVMVEGKDREKITRICGSIIESLSDEIARR